MKIQVILPDYVWELKPDELYSKRDSEVLYKNQLYSVINATYSGRLATLEVKEI